MAYVKKPGGWQNGQAGGTPLNADGLNDWEDRIGAAVDVLSAGISVNGFGVGLTADTGEAFKVIALSNGTLLAIPVAAEAPIAPTGLVLDVRLSSIKATWNTVDSATSYRVYRNGVFLASSTSTSYRDRTVVSGSTYTYTVRAVDFYGQWSAASASQVGTVDPAINSAPSVVVRAWPPTFPSNGKTLLHVNATDVDGHALELELGVSAGTITATNDPSIWIYEP